MFRLDKDVIVQSAIEKKKEEMLGDLMVSAGTLKKRAWEFQNNSCEETLDNLCECMAAMVLTLNQAIVVTSVHKTFNHFKKKMATLKASTNACTEAVSINTIPHTQAEGGEAQNHVAAS